MINNMEELKSSIEKFQAAHNMEESIDDAGVLWFVAWVEAENMRDINTVKDTAHMLLNGLPPIDKQYVDQWVQQMEEDEPADWDKIISNFYGIDELPPDVQQALDTE